MTRPTGRGFRSRTPEERRALGRQGGLASQRGAGAKQRWTRDQARAAAAKGGRRKKARP